MIGYQDGSYIPTHTLSIPIEADMMGSIRGFRVFTACRTCHGVLFHPGDHLQRLYSIAAKLSMIAPFPIEKALRILQITLHHNHQEQAGRDYLFHIILTGGDLSIDPVGQNRPARFYIATYPLQLPSAEKVQKGIRLWTHLFQRYQPEVKLTHYIEGVTAQYELARQGKADLPLFVHPEEHYITEGTSYNFFAVKEGKIITAPLDGSILPGITRKLILELAQSKTQYPIEERRIFGSEIPEFQEAFITSTTQNIIPIVQIDGQIIGTGVPGPISLQLLNLIETYQKEYLSPSLGNDLMIS